MGKVFDMYSNLGESGNNYFSRILSGLDSNSTNFGDLPPYFKKDVNDDVIKQGLTCMYGDLLKSHPNSVSLPLLYFASISDLSHRIHKRGHRQKSRTPLFYVTIATR